MHRRATDKLEGENCPIDGDDLKTGDCVSTDQLESPVGGMVATWKGKPIKKQYNVATVFVDHASRFIHLSMAHSTGGQEAVAAKRKFERQAADRDVRIKKYRADNGVFATKEFKAACEQLEQRLSLCGVNAHWQNGIAERQIKSIVETARTMLLHAMHHWPDEVAVDLWPYALQQAVALHNATPTSTGLTPEEIFTGCKSTNKLGDFHTFGCPVFVLESRLQAGSSVPKWQPLSCTEFISGHPRSMLRMSRSY